MTTHALNLPIAEITPATARDILWLERTLKRRYHGWTQDTDGRFVVEVERSNGKRVFCYATALETAVASARATVREGAKR